MIIESIQYGRGRLAILDQLLLPSQHVYTDIPDTRAAWNAIKTMQVRGAPAIGVTGCLSLAVELETTPIASVSALTRFVVEKLEYLVTARPTAVNMKEAAIRMSDLVKTLAEEPSASVEIIKQT